MDALSLLALSKANKALNGGGSGKVYSFTDGMNDELTSCLSTLIADAVVNEKACYTYNTTWGDEDNETIRNIADDVASGVNATLTLGGEYISIQHATQRGDFRAISYTIPIYPLQWGDFTVRFLIQSFVDEFDGSFYNSTNISVEMLTAEMN